MSRRLTIIATMLSLSSCGGHGNSMGGPPAHAYKHWDDWFVAATGLPLPWRPYPCTTEKKERFRGEVFAVLESKPTDECVYMTAPKRWRGLWRNEFEGSQFCPNARTECGYRNVRPAIWLSNGPNEGRGGLYAVEFVGRRTQFLGSYGHFGMFDHYMRVDRMISIKQLEPPPLPLTKAETIHFWKQCEAAGNCIPNWEQINKMED